VSSLRAQSRAPAVYAIPMAIRFYVGHGASGTSASMAGHVRGLVARGVDARAIDLPVKKAEDAVPVFRTIVPDGPRDTCADGAAIGVGGQSYGGRVASLAAAEPDTEYAALVLFSFPLHPPGRPERAEERSAHFPSIRCPVLFLSGESDPFARIDLLRARVELLRDAEVVTYPRLGHTLKPVLADALDRAAAFLLAHA
jgi:predicted alpha/beta-hydrolase family hydrolase